MFRKENMLLAIQESKKAASSGEIPVGCVVADKEGEVLSSSHNLTIAEMSPLKHAEMLAIELAMKRKKSQFLYDCDLYVTLEPCPMCAYAICLAKIRRVYFGCSDIKTGAIGGRMDIYASGICNHSPEIYINANSEECSRIISSFFKTKR